MIEVNKKLLSAALDRCAKVVSSKSPSEQLAHVKLELVDGKLKYSATDLVTSITGAIEAKGKSEPLTVNVKAILAATQSVIGDTVKLSVSKKDRLSVTGEGKRAFTCSTLSADNYPVLQQSPDKFTNVPGETLRFLVDRVLFAVSSDRDDQQNLKCVRIRFQDDILSAAGANGRALGFASDALEAGAGEQFTAIVSRSGIASVLSTDTDTVGIAVSQMGTFFRCGDETIFVKSVVDDFPPVDAILEQLTAGQAKKAYVKAPAVLEAISAVRRISPVADVDLTFSKGELKIESGYEGESGYSVDTVENAGDDSGVIRLATEYVSGALKYCESATLSFNDEMDPFVITDGMFTAIIMPLRRTK